jgi:hypothetical protein
MRGKILAFAGRVPPREIQLWRTGPNPTDYGVHVWSDRSVAEVGSVYSARGNPLLIDVEHLGAITPEGEPPPTGGYATLEIRNGEPWLTFEWSDYAAEQIASGQRRFLSPEYDTDKATGEILRLYRVSLVADPGTHHAHVLARAKVRPMDPTLKAALLAASSGEDPEAALASVRALLAELEKADSGAAAESPAEGDMAAAPPPPEMGGEEPPKEKPYAPTSADAEVSEPDVAAAADPPAAEKQAAAAPPSPVVPKLPKRIVVNAKPAAPAPAVDKVLATRMDNIERDMIIKDAGDKLTGPVKIWASSQPVEVVRQYLAALPGPLTPPAQPNPTRGGDGTGPNGAAPVYRSKEARERFKNSAPIPMGPQYEMDDTGRRVLRIHACCPGEYRAAQRVNAVQAAHVAGGK